MEKRKNRYGRPCIPDAVKRNRGMHVNLTEAERQALVEQADKLGITVSDLVRRIVFQRREENLATDKTTC